MFIFFLVGSISYNFNNKDHVVTGLNSFLLNSIKSMNLLYISWYITLGPLCKEAFFSLEDSKSWNSFSFLNQSDNVEEVTLYFFYHRFFNFFWHILLF